MRFDLLSLRLFVAVCEQQSIARAAESEHIAASALSKRISDLEDHLKATLFLRTPKGLELTPPGYSLLHHARVVMRDLTQMESELSNHALGLCGQVRIYANASAIVQHLPRDLGEFMSQHKAVRVELEQATSQEIVRAVAENAADIGIFGGVRPMAGLRILPYRSDKLVVLTPVGHPLSDRASVKFGEVVEFDLVGPQKGSFLDSLVQRAAADIEHALNLRLRVNGFESVCSMVAANLGVGLVPEECAKQYVATRPVVSVPLDEPWATRAWKICVRDSTSSPQVVQLLLEHLST
ncbi:MAG: LysR family transcriptional regulator [Ancalomicrobiaceae bacterium]|nr:LysR family transcriptional regulator [Ancalomicrobiaceae bacterium]